MTLQTSGPISMNEINRELKGYTASGTLIDLNDVQFRKMAAGTGTPGAADNGIISLGDFYGDRSHIRLTTASHTSTTGSGASLSTIKYNGYIKDFFGSGSHLGSLHPSAGVYIPSSGDTLNAFTEREVIACYTRHISGPYGFDQKSFNLTLAGQIYAKNTFTGIREKYLNNNYTGQFTKALADAYLSTATSGNARDTWTWYNISSTNLWTNFTTRYIHWY